MRKKHKDLCRGYGFIIDVGRDLIAIPAEWRLPAEEYGDFSIYRQEVIQTSASIPQHQPIIAGLIREGIKQHFKNNNSESLGALWQDFDRFCQQPQDDSEDEFNFCRRFGFSVKALRGNRWVIEFPITTTAIDNRSFADYYRIGNVAELADMIEAKRSDRLNRQNQPVGTRVLQYFNSPHGTILDALELSDEDKIFQHALLSKTEQQELAGKALRCLKFPKTVTEVPMHELRLILGSQNTREDHIETIISPDERTLLMSQLRDFIDGADIFGQQLRLATQPVALSNLEGGFICPPAVCVRDQNGGKVVIHPPTTCDEAQLRDRAKRRSQHIRRNGFLEQRPINPLLAFPFYVGEDAACRMQEDLNYVLRQQNLGYRFELLRFQNVEEIRREIERSRYDAAVVVLPPPQANRPDLHEQVKQRLEVPSQCIMLRNTMPKDVTCSLETLRQRDARKASRVQQRYEMVILNLLVKHHWLPFLPVESFYYNVQVGLDVGGPHNTEAVSCLGYGFSDPKANLIFRPDAIPIDVQKAEPIPTDNLFKGLLKQFEVVHADLAEAGVNANFERALFIRDGQLLGDKDQKWNERDALQALYRELIGRNWITSNAVWTAVEVMKDAEEWRLFRGGVQTDNPFAGRYVLPYDDENVVLVCTTGAQYLTQGTSNPLKLRIIELQGQADYQQVIQDIVWGADLCFTKPDVGMRLPWVLQVADAGALQQAKSYKFTGITV